MQITAHLTPDFAESRGGTVLSADPLIFTVPDMLTDSERKVVRGFVHRTMKRAVTTGADGLIRTRERTNRYQFLKHDASPEVLAVCTKMAALVDLPLAHAEDLQVIRYEKGEQYKPHLDTFDPAEGFQDQLSKGGQRVVTVLAYLTSCLEGGETVFPRLNLKVPCRAGHVVVFESCHKDEPKPHPDSLHGGAPVRNGIKWAFNLWFRQAPHRQPFDLAHALPSEMRTPPAPTPTALDRVLPSQNAGLSTADKAGADFRFDDPLNKFRRR